MSEAENLAIKSNALADEGAMIHLCSWVEIRNLLRADAAELRRLSAELEDARTEATALRVTEENLRAELEALKKAMGEPVGFVTPDTLTVLTQSKGWDWLPIWSRQTSKSLVPLYTIPKDKP